MYNVLKELFPFFHSVFALAVSLSRTQGNAVALSRFLCPAVGIGDDLVLCDDGYANNDDGLSSKEEDGKNNGDNKELSKREHAMLEFFIAKIQVRSQKTMKYWSMIPPLASHSWGHMHNPPCHPLHGAGCSSKTL